MKENSRSLIQQFNERILVLDGAMGTAIQSKNLTAYDFGGEEYEGCNEYLVLTRPDVIESIHKAYLESGCDIVETNTFGGTPIVLDEYGLGKKAYEINLAAAKIARKCCDEFSTKQKPRYVAGSIGPTTIALSVTGGATFEELIENFYSQAKALYEGGVDYFLLETCQDTRNVKAGLLAFDRLFSEVKEEIPVAVSATIEPMGTMLAGQSIDALYAALENRDLLYLGLNCATGPEFMTDHIRTLSKLSRFRIACVPNAGLPDEHGHYLENPEMVSKVIERFIESGWINCIGGCCGTGPSHIHALSELSEKYKPRPLPIPSRSFLSGIDYLEVTDEMRPILVGERTNVIGSRKFKKLIADHKFEEASEIARAQIKAGAQIIDVCLANPDRDEMSDMKQFLELAIKKVRAPIMIDSTDEKVIEMALTYCQGKSIINSINLEDGEERFEKVCPIVQKFGAAVVVGTIDDDPLQGMAVSRERKLSVAKRSYELLTKKYGIKEEDIYWDPLVFPCATGDQNYVGSALETIEGIKLIKKEFPKTKSVLGISNVSFGLPEAGREILNSVFLYHCVQAGLDLAIVNSEKLERYAKISDEEKFLADNLLFNKSTPENPDPIAAFAAHFRTKVVKPKVDRTQIPLEQRLSNAILEGSKEGLIEDLNEALKKQKPLEIINGPLMKGMDEVGRLFNQNKLIVAEVLQSAEVMKAAVAHLEPFMEKSETASRGKIVLATVKGDVHDIGKNLVDIILSNNGFKVINLGIKIPPEQILSAVKEHKPDMIGLSGLLVKSAQMMVTTAEDLSKSGIKLPILVGGAALSERFTNRNIAKAYSDGSVIYAKDAMNGLDIAKTVIDPNKFEELKNKIKIAQKELENAAQSTVAPVASKNPTARSSSIEVLSSPPAAPDFENHIIKNTPIQQIWKYINPLMLYGRHLGVKGGIVRKLEAAALDRNLRKELQETESKSLAIWDTVQEVKEEFANSPLMSPRAVYQFFRAQSIGNTIELSNGRYSKVSEFTFARQNKANGLSLADYISPQSTDKSKDNICLFVTTVGVGVREGAAKLKEDGKYLKSYILQALAIESAEAYAELLHSQIRMMWGFPDQTEMTMMERFQAKYRGKRYSFGYPACPRLDDQTELFKLLNPEQIGVQLTDGFMMDPEASVSAIVFHHPQATYFSVGQDSDNREG